MQLVEGGAGRIPERRGPAVRARAQWRERRGQDSRTSCSYPAAHRRRGRRRRWAARRSGPRSSPMMRRMIREREYPTAYQLAAGHGLTSGEAFRDAEWMAGWLALEKLNDPQKAEAHFRVFGAGVQTPISDPRAKYWLGEALTKQGRAGRGAGGLPDGREVSVRVLRPARLREGERADAGRERRFPSPCLRRRRTTSARRSRGRRRCARRSCWRRRDGSRASSGSHLRWTTC